MKTLQIFIFFFVFIPVAAQTGRVEIKNEKYGIVDTRTKKLIADYIYEDVEILHGLGYLVMQNDKIGLLDKSGTKILNCVYEDIYQILDNPNYVVTENQNGKHAVFGIKEHKNILSGFVADLYNPVYGPYDELNGKPIKTVVIIEKNHKKTLLELPAKYLFPLEYDEIVPCIAKPGQVLLKKQNVYRIYRIKENHFITPSFTLQAGDERYLINNKSCMLNGNDFFPVKINGKWALMNIYGKYKLSPKYDEIRMSQYPIRSKAFTALRLQNRWYIYNAGKMKPFDVDDFLGFWYNYGVIIKNEKVLFYNTSGNRFLEIKLKNPADAQEKVFARAGKYGLVNYKSRIIIDFLYQDMTVAGPVVIVKKNNKYGLMDIAGNQIIALKYDDIRIGSVKDKVLIFKQYGKYGLMDFNGKIRVNPKYTYISSFKDGKAEVKVYKTAYQIDTYGKRIE